MGCNVHRGPGVVSGRGVSPDHRFSPPSPPRAYKGGELPNSFLTSAEPSCRHRFWCAWLVKSKSEIQKRRLSCTRSKHNAPGQRSRAIFIFMWPYRCLQRLDVTACSPWTPPQLGFHKPRVYSPHIPRIPPAYSLPWFADRTSCLSSSVPSYRVRPSSYLLHRSPFSSLPQPLAS